MLDVAVHAPVRDLVHLMTVSVLGERAEERPVEWAGRLDAEEVDGHSPGAQDPLDLGQLALR